MAAKKLSKEFVEQSMRKLSKEQARAMGKKSGESRRVKKTAKEFAIAALNAVKEDKNGNKMVVKDILVQKMIAKAVQEQDLNAVKYLFDLIGEGPVAKQEIALKRAEGETMSLADIEKEIARIEKLDKEGNDEQSESR